MKQRKIYRIPKRLVRNPVRSMLPLDEELIDTMSDGDFLLVKVTGNDCPLVEEGAAIPHFEWSKADAPRHIKR